MAMGHPFLITMSTKVASKPWKDLISEHPCSVTLAHFLGLYSESRALSRFPLQVSQVWFSEKERIFTTAAMAGAAAFGAMIGDSSCM